MGKARAPPVYGRSKPPSVNFKQLARFRTNQRLLLKPRQPLTWIKSGLF